MKKRGLAGLMTHQYKKLPVTKKMWMHFNVIPRKTENTLYIAYGYIRIYY